MIEEKLQTAEGCPRAPFQEARAGLPPRRSRPASGGGRGLRNSLRFCPPFASFPPGSGLSVFFLKNKKKSKQSQKNQKPISSSPQLPSAIWGQEERMLLEAWLRLGPCRVLTTQQAPAGEAWTAFVICSEASAGSSLRCGTTASSEGGGRQGAEGPSSIRPEAIAAWEHKEPPGYAQRNVFCPLNQK